MKVILSYGSYFSYGKKYQVKFEYDNQKEIECIKELMNSLKSTKMFNFYYIDNLGKISFKETNTFGGTDISKDVLHPFISMLLSLQDTTVIIGKDQYNNYEQNNIEQSINNLHIFATLNIGKYFSYDQTYYIIFKYASIEQKDEMLYEFYNHLNIIANKNEERINEGKDHIIPILVDKYGKLELKNNPTIGGINIPEDLLETIIKSFIENHNMIINIGTEVLKDTFDPDKFKSAIKEITKTTAKSRKLALV